MPPSTVKVRVASGSSTLTVSAASSLVIRSLDELPLSLASATVGCAIVVSSVKVRLALLLLPAVSVSVTTTVWLPSTVGAV